MNYIITKNEKFYTKIGQYNHCSILELENLPGRISVDTETTGLFAKEHDMFCIQIGTGEDNYIIDLYNTNDSGICYTFSDVVPYIEDKIFVMQNGLFDLGFFLKHKFIPKRVQDTMLAARILYNGQYENRRADFQAIMHREIGVWYDKTNQKNIHLVKLSQPSTIKYSFNDVDRLMEAHDVMWNKLIEAGQLETYKLHCRFLPALAYMEQCGLPIDAQYWLDKMHTDQTNEAESIKLVEEYIYDHIPKYRNGQLNFFAAPEKKIHVNVDSSAQMIPIFNALGINTKDKDGKDSIDKKIIGKSKHEFVAIWKKYQDAHHRVTTFGQTIYDRIKEDGRIYTNFNPMVDTARLASRKGSINFLNFPSDSATRSCFRAKEGHKMIVCDWSGQETVIAADVSGDAAMTKSVVEGADLHSMMARVLFPELQDFPDEVIMEEHSKKRSKAKAPRFAMQYGGNAYTIHVNENIPMDEAEDIFDKFIDLHKGLFDWGEKQLKLAIRRGYIQSADGWKLYLPRFDQFKEFQAEMDAITKEEWTLYRIGKTERQREFLIMEYNSKLEKGKEKKEFILSNKRAYDFYMKKKYPISRYFSLYSEYKRLSLNNPVQTRGAHQMKLALSMIFEWIVRNDLLFIIKMCNAVHDETVIEAPDEYAEVIKVMVESTMRDAGNFYLENLKIKADANVGESWYEAK